jgi:hypothetical protein
MADAASPKSNATQAEVAARVEEVLRIRLDGAQFHDVVQYASEKGWGVSPRQVGNYIRRADDLLVERQDHSRRRLIARHLAQRAALYARAVNAADYRTALAVLQDEAKLRGLYVSDREYREVCKLAAEQEVRIRVLESRLDDPVRDRPPVPPAGEPARPAARPDPAAEGPPG